jgi:DHA1 family bicyclomycin/chloramphenicol resistance-like MFS transporter
LGDRRSLLLAGAAALNYGAIFMFIASAPVIVLDWLKLNEREFAWLFVPTIGGLMLGAMISGRLAGGRSPATIVRLSFLVIGAGSVIGVLSSALLPSMIPWTLIQPTLIATGAAISAPTMVLMMLDRFPQIRGTVASLQAATTLTCNAIVSGLISPLVAAHPLWLSLGTAALNVVAAGLWAVYHWRPGPDRVAQSA